MLVFGGVSTTFFAFPSFLGSQWYIFKLVWTERWTELHPSFEEYILFTSSVPYILILWAFQCRSSTVDYFSRRLDPPQYFVNPHGMNMEKSTRTFRTFWGSCDSVVEKPWKTTPKRSEKADHPWKPIHWAKNPQIRSVIRSWHGCFHAPLA